MEMRYSDNIVLIDSNQEEGKDFCKALFDITELEWKVLDYKSNGSRTNKIDNLERYLKYFIFPFRIFLHRKRIKNIIAWQQFYGLIFAFYCRLFHVKKVNSLTAMTFIYKKKKGVIGIIYHKFIKYIVTSEYIDIFTCTADKERELYSTLFNVDIEKFVFVPWGGVLDHSKDVDEDELRKQDYLFAPGRSNRDWEFLINSLIGTKYNLKIACDELENKIIDNIEIYNNIHENTMWRYLKNCFCIVISIKNTSISAGQTVLIQAMQFKKPLIITKSEGLTDDYIIDGYNGIVINKSKDELIRAVDKLHNNPGFYDEIVKNAYKDYEGKYSIYQLGKNISNAIIKKLY